MKHRFIRLDSMTIHNEKLVEIYALCMCITPFFLLLIPERGREGEREGEKHLLPLARALNGDRTYNTRICPSQKSISDLSVYGMVPS